MPKFIDGRLELVNQGKEPDDLFEEEILQCRTAAGGTKSYKQLVENLKLFDCPSGGDSTLMPWTRAKAKCSTKHGLKNLLRIRRDERKGVLLGEEESRPRRPVSRHTAREDDDDDDTEDNKDTWDGAVSGSVVETPSGLQKEEEEEGEDLLLCDPEEMDLLGEILDTLSSRSLHERGLLYGTHILDLFGPDSHDFITKRGPATPSQESLSLSISGSGSLHSWNLEEGLQATEEGSEVTEDSDLQSLALRVPEEEVQEEGPPVAREPRGRDSGPGELGEERETGSKREETEGGIKHEVNNERTNNKEAELEEDKKEKREEEAHGGKKKKEEEVENRENKGLPGNKDDGRDGDEEVEAGGEVEKRRRQEPLCAQGDLAREVKREESQGWEKDAETVDPQADGLLERPGDSLVEVAEEREEQDRRVDPRTTASPGAHGLADAPRCELPVAPEERGEAGGEEPEVGQTSCPPKVLSVVARFEPQASGRGVRFQTRGLSETGRSSEMPQGWKNSQSCPTKNSNIPLGAGGLSEEAPPSIKFSDLKKRF